MSNKGQDQMCAHNRNVEFNRNATVTMVQRQMIQQLTAGARTRLEQDFKARAAHYY